MLTDTDSLSEAEVNKLIQGRKRPEKTILLKPFNETIRVYHWERGREDVVAYYTKDSVKIAVLCFLYPHSSDLYVLRDKRYEPLIRALVKHKKFELTRLNSLTAPTPPFIEPE